MGNKLPFNQWVAGRGKSVVGAAILITTPDHRLLVLHPTYHDFWQAPGGGSDHGEDPYTTAVRETYEETGITVTGPPILLATDWYPTIWSDSPGITRTPQDPSDLHFFFKGPVMTEEEIRNTIRLSSEHDQWALYTRDQLAADPAQIDAIRLPAALDAVTDGRPRYLVNGKES
jgi:8-oxo-dGTP diphosphatase